jgi:hypothetical protein
MEPIGAGRGAVGWRARLTQPLSAEQARRVRLALTLLPVVIFMGFAWYTWAVDVGVPGRLDRSGHVKGHDFVHFYVLGQIARDRAANDLYSFDAQAARVDRLVPEDHARFLPVHPPQVAVFFAPLAALPYPVAVPIWLAITAGLYAACCRRLWQALPALRYDGWATAVLCACFFPFYSSMAAGQTSAFGLAWFTAGFLALAGNRPWLGGVALGSLVYKPPLGLLVPLFLASTKQWKAFGGAIIAVVVQFAVGWAWFSGPSLVAYVANFRNAATANELLEAQPYLMHSLRSFFLLMLPSRTLAEVAYLLTSIGVVLIAVRAWRVHPGLERRYAVLVVATILVSPHLYTYDLILLVPALFFVASDLRFRGAGLASWGLPVLVYVTAALDGVTRVTGIQLSTLVLAGFLVSLAGLGDPPIRADKSFDFR